MKYSFIDQASPKARMSWGRHQGIVAVVFAVEIVVVEVAADIVVKVVIVVLAASAVVEAVLDAVELDTSEDVTVALLVAVDCVDMVDAADVDWVDTFDDKVSLNISINHSNCFSCNLTLNYLWIKSERKQRWNLFCLIDQRSQ